MKSDRQHRQAIGLTVLLLVTVVTGCATSTPNKVSMSRHGAVATAQPLASDAAARVLARGGNAADAAVAAAFVLGVVEPSMNGIGGRSQILVDSGNGKLIAYNGMTEVPRGYRKPEKPQESGYGTVAIPGVVAALGRLHREHGSMEWESLVQPGLRLATKGFHLLPGEARRHEHATDPIAADPGLAEALLTEDGATYAAGERLVQPDLANTLKRLAVAGASEFYRGETAVRIAADMAHKGGFVSSEDLADYRVPDGRLISTSYRGAVVHSIAAPGGGGLVVRALNILENLPLSELTEINWGLAVSQAVALALLAVNEDYSETDLDRVADKVWAAGQAEKIVLADLGVVAEVTQSPRAEIFDWTGDTWGSTSHHTTHFSIVDCAGMSVSITQTLGPLLGAKVMTPGLGFAYAQTMGTYLPADDQMPGARPRTSIAPTLVEREGQPTLILGAAGGLRITSAIVQVISRVLDREMTLEAAINAPRMHPAITYEEGERVSDLRSVAVEVTARNGWTAEQIKSLQGSPFQVDRVPRVGAFGRVHAVSFRDGLGHAVADPDWEGSAVSPSESRCEGD